MVEETLEEREVDGRGGKRGGGIAGARRLDEASGVSLSATTLRGGSVGAARSIAAVASEAGVGLSQRGFGACSRLLESLRSRETVLLARWRSPLSNWARFSSRFEGRSDLGSAGETARGTGAGGLLVAGGRAGASFWAGRGRGEGDGESAFCCAERAAMRSLTERTGSAGSSATMNESRTAPQRNGSAENRVNFPSFFVGAFCLEPPC